MYGYKDGSKEHKQRFLIELEPNTKYHQITFGGCGFLLPYHFGAIMCMFDNEISVDNAVGISGGCMAALAMLGGSDIYIGLRQGIIDLPGELYGTILTGFNMLFMNFYYKYMWSYRCLKIPFELAKQLSEHTTKSCKFELHDMSSNRLSALDLSGRFHCLMVSLHIPKHVGNGLDPLAESVSGSFIDDSFLKLAKTRGAMGRAMKSILVPVVIENYENDAEIVQAAVLSGGIPGVTTFWPRYFDEHFCCLDRMTSRQIKIKGSSENLAAMVECKEKHIDEVREEMDAAALIDMKTIIVSPIAYDTDIFDGSDIALCAGMLNPFPVFSFQLGQRKQAFVQGYMDMQRRIKNPKLLDPTRSICVKQEIGTPGKFVEKCVDSEETLQDFIDFILYESYAKHWRRKDLFMLDVDGIKITDYYTKHNVAFQPHEQFLIGIICALLLILFLISPKYFSICLLSILTIGAIWILSYLYGVERINREHTREINEKMKEDELNPCNPQVPLNMDSCLTEDDHSNQTPLRGNRRRTKSYNGLPVHPYNLRKRN